MEEKDSTTIRRAVINKAIGFIFDNIEGEITVDDVAKHCGYSKYHLMRMFKEDTDEALYQFMKRVRLERSAWRLKVEKDKSVAEIGMYRLRLFFFQLRNGIQETSEYFRGRFSEEKRAAGRAKFVCARDIH